MTGLSHGIISWFIGQGAGEDLRDRRLVAWLGVAPDFDSITYAWGAIRSWSIEEGYNLYVATHHKYTHGIVMILAAIGICAAFGRRRLRTSLLAAFAVIVHLAGDIIGSGPEFPIYPLWPARNWCWTVSWSVPVQEWPNLLLGFLLLVGAFLYARYAGRSPLEMFSRRMDEELMRHIR